MNLAKRGGVRPGPAAATHPPPPAELPHPPENRLSEVLPDIGGSVPNYFYYDADQRRMITEDSQGRTYFLYDGEKVAVEKNAAGTTQTAYVNRAPSIYSPLIYMARSGAKPYHLFNHLGTTVALASCAQALTDIGGPQLAETWAGASCALGVL